MGLNINTVQLETPTVVDMKCYFLYIIYSLITCLSKPLLGLRFRMSWTFSSSRISLRIQLNSGALYLNSSTKSNQLWWRRASLNI